MPQSKPQPQSTAPTRSHTQQSNSQRDAFHVMKRCSQLFWLFVLGLTVTGFVMADDLQQFVTNSQRTAQESPGVVVPLMMGVWVLVAVGAPPGNTFLCITCGLLYGWWGLCICLGWGAAFASSIGFVVCRAFGRPHIEQMVARRHRLQALKQAVDDNGAFVTVVARVSPILPYGPTTVVMSVSAIKLRDFALATVLGLVPYDCTAVYFGTTISDLSKFDQIAERPATLGLTVVGVILSGAMAVYIGHSARKKMENIIIEVGPPDDTDVSAGISTDDGHGERGDTGGARRLTRVAEP